MLIIWIAVKKKPSAV